MAPVYPKSRPQPQAQPTGIHFNFSFFFFKGKRLLSKNCKEWKKLESCFFLSFFFKKMIKKLKSKFDGV